MGHDHINMRILLLDSIVTSRIDLGVYMGVQPYVNTKIILQDPCPCPLGLPEILTAANCGNLPVSQSGEFYTGTGITIGAILWEFPYVGGSSFAVLI